MTGLCLWGIICPCETPEGASVGVVKNLALTCVITIHASSHSVRTILMEDADSVVCGAEAYAHTRIMVNGTWRARFNADNSLAMASGVLWFGELRKMWLRRADAARARGGVGLMVTGGMAPNAEGGVFPGAAGLYSAQDIANHRVVTQRVQAAGGRAVGEQDVGPALSCCGGQFLFHGWWCWGWKCRGWG